MNPDAVIETYVRDVARQLPRKQRHDVAFELRSLLNEELQGRAAEAGRPADDAMALELLTAFGRPPDVADRYRAAGFTIIRPSEAPRFAWVAFGGVALQWILSLVATYSTPVDPALGGGDWLSRLGGWWLTWGLGSFWWPGFMVSLSIIAGWIAARRESSGIREKAAKKTAQRSVDRDRVSRPLMVLLLALGVGGASLVIALPSLAVWGSDLPESLLAAFAFDDGFLSTRAPWVLVLWAASLAVGIAVLVAGRWVPLTRRLALVEDLAWIGLLAWWMAGGPIFVTAAADGTTKLCLLFIIGLIALDVVMTLRRLGAPLRVPTA
jgi:hypothetical protein